MGGALLTGKIAPEVVHDINNLLTGILGYAELLNMKPLADEGVRKGLETISYSAEKCKVLLGRLVSLTREEIPQPLADINAGVQEALELRRCAFRHQQIEVTQHLSPNLPPMLTDGILLARVLLTLFLLSEKALAGRSEGKRMDIQTRFDLERKRVSVLVFANGVQGGLSDWTRLPETAESWNEEDLDSFLSLRQAQIWVGQMEGTLELGWEAGEGPLFSLHLPVR